MTGSEQHRSVERSVELEASPETVWKALTDAAQLESWFPLEASVEPGEGGKVMVSWGSPSKWESRITIWDPPRHLQVRDPQPPDAPSDAVPVGIDYHIEGRGGRTVLRVVNSGFSASADWDEYYDAVQGGWAYFLLNLKHYLERHAGTHRAMVWKRVPVEHRSRADSWPFVLRALGVDPSARPGDDATFDMAGESHSGQVLMARPPGHIALSLPGLNDGLLFVELEPGGERWHLGIWISTYGLPGERVDQLQRSLDAAAPEIAGVVPG